MSRLVVQQGVLETSVVTSIADLVVSEPATVVVTPRTDSIVTTGPSLQGPPGPPGVVDPALTAYRHVQSAPATVWLVQHALGYDPAGVQVHDANGEPCGAIWLQYLEAGQSLRLSFEDPMTGTVTLS